MEVKKSLSLLLTFHNHSTHRSNSRLSAACIMATMVLVTEVPMLEPMMMGTADFTSSTEGKRGKQPTALP